MVAKWGSRGYITHLDGIREDVIFWFAHPDGLIDFYTKDAKYIFMVNEKLCIKDTRKPSYSFYTEAPEFEVDLETLEFVVLDDLELVDIARLDLWKKEE